MGRCRMRSGGWRVGLGCERGGPRPRQGPSADPGDVHPGVGRPTQDAGGEALAGGVDDEAVGETGTLSDGVGEVCGWDGPPPGPDGDGPEPVAGPPLEVAGRPVAPLAGCADAGADGA